MAKKSIQIAKIAGSYPEYEVYCNSKTHDGEFAGAETLKEAREVAKTPENWCMGCNKENAA
jgi:hypothetical protein